MASKPHRDRDYATVGEVRAVIDTPAVALAAIGADRNRPDYTLTGGSGCPTIEVHLRRPLPIFDSMSDEELESTTPRPGLLSFEMFCGKFSAN